MWLLTRKENILYRNKINIFILFLKNKIAVCLNKGFKIVNFCKRSCEIFVILENNLKKYSANNVAVSSVRKHISERQKRKSQSLYYLIQLGWWTQTTFFRQKLFACWKEGGGGRAHKEHDIMYKEGMAKWLMHTIQIKTRSSRLLHFFHKSCFLLIVG